MADGRLDPATPSTMTLAVGAPPPAVRVVLATALAYALFGFAGLLLASGPGLASPLYPSAGMALAAVLVYGRPALGGVLLGALVVSMGLAAVHGSPGLTRLALVPAILAAGAALQAGVGAALLQRFVAQPVVLTAPRDILIASLLGALLACGVSASIAAPTLLATGAITREALSATWCTWWGGDALGVLIGAPLALTFIGRPPEEWRPRRLVVGLPLLVATLLVGAGIHEFARLDHHRTVATFGRDTDRLAAEAQARLATPLYALQALHGSARGPAAFDADTLHGAARWWLAQPLPVQAMGYSERIAADAVSAFEATVRARGLASYRVFDRDGGAERRREREVVAVRLIEPMEGNSGALGVNAMSVPAARAAIVATRASGEPAATAGFALTQSVADETGVVIYQALYRGAPASPAQRLAAFRGLVFVTVRTDLALAGLAQPGQQYLRWCVIDADRAAARRRLAGPAGCEAAAAEGAGLQAVRPLMLAGRALELHIAATENAVPGHQREAAWLLAAAGLAAVAMLGALLLTVTGHRRHTALAVHAGTAELRREADDRAQADSALRESEARLRSILDNVPLGVMFLDAQGHVIDCNPRLGEMVGRSAAALRGSWVTELPEPAEVPRLNQWRRKLLKGDGPSVMDDVRLRPREAVGGPQEVRVRIRASALRGPDGRVTRLVSVLEDITEHLRLEESERALHRAEAANRAKSEFLSRMSHELRTPLNAMIGFAQLLGLDRDPGLAPHQREWTQQVQRAGWHLLEMINETLDLARIESGAVQLELVPVALAPLVAACLAMVAGAAAARGIRVGQALEDGAEAVLGDATRLKQVLTNLLSNAVKYNRDGGTVTLTARRLPGDERIEIAVADSGLGMTAAQLDGLFQPYNRLGREGSGIEGTGIGLVISRRLAELMNGHLDASSESGHGSIFTVQLPAAAAVDEPMIRYTDASPAPYQQRRVHYIEDNETNVEVMRGIFAQRPQIGLSVSLLGLDGLVAVRRDRPDLILLDMQLPDISGLELLRHFQQDDDIAAIPVIVVSADATPPNMQQAFTVGALHYVTKPLEVAHFLALVDGVLEDTETRF